MTIEEIKSSLTIMDVVMQYGLLPDRQGKLCCPFHEDKTPSFQIYSKTNTWHCFSGNCNAGSGDVIDFVMKKDSSNKYQAIMKCKEIIQQLHPEALPTVHHQVNSPVIDKQDKANTLEKIFTYFKNGLTTSSLGRNYLNTRGLDRAKLQAAGIMLGYNSGQYHHGTQNLIEGSVKYGLLIPSDRVNTGGSGYNIWGKMTVVFPLLNKQNNIISFYARSVNDMKNNKHYYLKDSEGLFPCYPKHNTKSLLITESIIDAATLQQLTEITSQFTILAAYGTNRLTDEHLQAIKELNELEEIVFYFDGDAAGITATKKYATTLKELLPNVTVSVVQTLENEDVNSIYCKYGIELIVQQINTRVSAETEVITLQTPPPVVEEKKQEPQKKPIAKKETPKQELTTFTTDNPEALVWQNEQLHILILGGIKLSGLDRLKVTLKIKSKKNHYTPLRHNLDLYNTEHLLRLKQNVSEQLEVPLTLADVSFNEVIEALENYRLERVSNLQPTKHISQPMTTLETDTALAYLKHPELMHNTMSDIGKTGIVGEHVNRLTMFLVFLSRITSDPLHIISFGASGTGKTYLQEGVAKLIPIEDKLEITTLSGNALYYFKNDDLKNKLLLIEDYDGVQDGLYALRELSSKQKITKTVSLKDSKGNIKTYTFVVEGPVCIAGCTTKESTYEDNANRCILLYLDTSAKQDELIMEYQRKVSAGLINYKEEEIFRTQLRNAQRMIKPIRVVNPYAPCLKIPKNVLKPRRSHRLYLRFIEIVTLYNQYQREIKINTLDNEPYIETTFEDIAWANKLLKHILIRKADELTTACRTFLERLKSHLKDKKETTFKAKDIRGELRLHASSVKKYLLELYNNGYIKQTGGNKARGYVYEIASYEEYETLKSGINNALDDLLENIKKNGCKGTSVSNDSSSEVQ
ncbi:MAG: toprim domain-containing protein [Bacteroidetes bacterium]|nr:toprim domain-containing protein [Bacteroidota bacterium]MCA6443770.1 toprim domain-containing protein [Bacteroidota bacterium]